MSNILDYIEWRGDLAFDERPFNDVDNLILSELAYADLKGVFGSSVRDDAISVTDAYRKYVELGKDQSKFICNPQPAFEKCAGTARFGNIMVRDYVDLLNAGNRFQFAAMTFVLKEGLAYVAFRGTDDSIAGWREDLNFTFMKATPAQLCAAEYLDRAARNNPDCRIFVGGHSKGGNLAMYAAAFCEEACRARVDAIYSNDGPGFNGFIAENPNYQNILHKVTLIIPEGSLVGIMLFNKQEKKIIQSSGKTGVGQHIPYNWLLNKTGFVPAERQSSVSVHMDKVLDEWLVRLNARQREDFVNIVFDTLESSGAKTFTEINANKWTYYNAIWKAATRLAPEQIGTLLEVMGEFVRVGREIIRDEKRQTKAVKGTKELLPKTDA
ncbi:MAG: DUF2974 domain-containing protein [Lachnospiraceae bacterium]|nr:DUF2974 domain-containing protein [Lachnospiraceae bacterium]